MYEFKIFIAAILNIIGQTSENLSIPLWIDRIRECSDPFVIFQSTTLWYFPMFMFTSLYINGYKKTFDQFTWKQHKYIISVGFFDALNGALVLPASPPDKTPAIITALLNGSILIPLILIKHYYYKLCGIEIERDKYKKMYLYLAICFTIFSTYLFVYTPIRNQVSFNAEIFWWIIFYLGAIAGVFYNIQQEVFFKKYGLKTVHDFIGYLNWETFYLMIWAWIMTPLNFIPKFGYASDHIECNYYNTMKDTHTYPPALGFAIMFNVGYYIAFIASAYLNKTDALIGVTTGSITNALVIIISYPITELTPDKSTVDIGLTPLMFTFGVLTFYFYGKWEEEVKPYEMEAEDGYTELPDNVKMNNIDNN